MNIQVFFHLQHILTCLNLLRNLLGLVFALTTSYKRRKARAILVMLILRRKTILKSLGPHTKKTGNHRFWKRPGTTNAWWENVINDKVIAEEWRENFGMAKASFIQLCNELRPYLLKQTYPYLEVN